MISRSADPLDGKRINQRYRIKTVDQWQELAIFCTGEDLEKNKIVSIVIVDRHTIRDPELFEKQAKRKARLTHQNVIPIEAPGRTQEEEPFIVIDATAVKTLAESLTALDALSPKQSVEFIISLIDALIYLSANGESVCLPLPDCIAIDKQPNITGRIYNLNFGESVTQENLFMMNPSSMIETAKFTPPEYIKEKKIDARSQVYTLSCILYRLLTGVNPFDSDDLVELQSQHLAVPPRAFHTVRPDAYILPALESCVMKGLNKDPAQRHDSLLKLKTDLRNAIQRVPWWQRRQREAASILLIASSAGVYASGAVVQPFWSNSSPPQLTATDTAQTDQIDTSSPQPDPSAAETSPIPEIPGGAQNLYFVKLSGSEHKVLPAGNYKCSGIMLSESAQLTSDGDVSLWIVSEGGKAPLNAKEHTSVSSGKNSKSFKIYYSGKDAMVLSGDAKIKANVLAPFSILEASGRSTICGEFTSAGQKLADQAKFINQPETE